MNDIIRKKKRKFIIIMSLIVFIPLIFCTIFGIVDYYRAINGKKPIFIYQTASVTNFDMEVGITGNTTLPSKKDVTNVGVGSNYTVFEDIVLDNKKASTYYGIGYTVSICDNETGNYNFQFGNKQKEPCFSTLICTKTISDNGIQSFEYFFFDGIVYRIHSTLTIPTKQIENEEAYKKELIEINDINGCGVTFVKNETTYVTTQMCNISNMTDSDVEKVYSVNRESMEQTRTKIINKYTNDKDMTCN